MASPSVIWSAVQNDRADDGADCLRRSGRGVPLCRVVHGQELQFLEGTVDEFLQLVGRDPLLSHDGHGRIHLLPRNRRPLQCHTRSYRAEISARRAVTSQWYEGRSFAVRGPFPAATAERSVTPCPPESSATEEVAAVLAGKTALVTGGSRGIGRAIVQRLTRDGAEVVFSFIHHETAASAVVAAAGGRAHAVRADLALVA